MSVEGCSICLDSTEATPNFVSVTHSGQSHNHIFHAHCINRWITQQRLNRRRASAPFPTCPLCKGRMTHLNGVEIPREEIPPLISAVRSRNTEAIRRVVSRGVQGISQEVYYQALNEARENAEILRVLLILMLSPEEAIEHFSSLGFLEVVQVLLENGGLSERSRGRAVVQASKRGHADIVQALLRNGSISREHRNKAHSWASRHGHEGVVQVLSENSSSVKNRPS